MKSKILFIEPPPTIEWSPDSQISTAGRRHPSLNVTGEKVYSYLNLSAASILRNSQYQVFYIHAQTEGKTIKDIENIIQYIKPDFIVLMVEHINLSISNKIGSIAHKTLNCKVIFCGPFVTALHTDIKNMTCDIIARKEWDYTILNIVDAFKNNEALNSVKGITYLDNNKNVIINDDAELIKNLDELPIPAYDLLDLSKFYESVFKRFPCATMITSRGCPFNCVYCSFPNTIYSHKYRTMSSERVINEVRYLVKELGVKEIRFDDDTFDIDKNRVFSICEGFIQLREHEKLDFIWSAQCRPGNMTLELAQIMKKAGCTFLLYGVESGNDEILNKIKKATTKEKIENGVKNAKKAGIDVLNCVMLGFYWDTAETIQESIDFACKLNATYTQFSIPTPLPGTEYYDLLISEPYHFLSFQRFRFQHFSTS